MKSVLFVGLFGVLVSLSYAAKVVESQSSPETRTDIQPGQERGDHHGGGGGGGGGGGHGGHGGGGHVQYHETHGQELFQGEEWMILVPLLLIPLVALACWYLWGGNGKADEGWGWDRMGYSDNSVGGAYQQQGAYERSFVPADTMDKSTHQRIFNSIQQ